MRRVNMPDSFHIILSGLLICLTGCQPLAFVPLLATTPTATLSMPTMSIEGGPTVAAPTISPSPPTYPPLLQTYAYGELLPDMRIPIQRAMLGEGGWYVVIGSQEGWDQFIQQLGQPADIWEPIDWQREILIGALMGVRQGRGYQITLTDLSFTGVEVQATVRQSAPAAGQTSEPWITYPFHLVRAPRIELPLGVVTFRFVASDGAELDSQVLDIAPLDIVWLSGPAASFPTPTPVPASLTPAPTPTSTPVPNLRILSTILDVLTEQQGLRIIPSEGNWERIDLMEGTSLLQENGQPTSLSLLKPGMVIGVLGYAGNEKTIRAAHIDIMNQPIAGAQFATYYPRPVALATIYDGYTLPLSALDIIAPAMLTATLTLSQIQALTENGLVIAPADYSTMADLYTDPRYKQYPVFISVDSALHTLDAILTGIQRTQERGHLLAELTLLNRELFTLSWEQYQTVQASSIPNRERIAAAAHDNAAYFAVALKLLDPDWSPPIPIENLVQAELDMIAAASNNPTDTVRISPLSQTAQRRLDYARLAPPPTERYDPAAARYVQVAAWHSLMTWRLSSLDETLSAVLIAHLMRTNAAARILWERIYVVQSFFQGQQAALSLTDYDRLISQIWGESPSLAALGDVNRLNEMVQAARKLAADRQADIPLSALPNELALLGQPLAMDHPWLPLTAPISPTHTATPPLASVIQMAPLLNTPEILIVAQELGYSPQEATWQQIYARLADLDETRWTAQLAWNWLYLYRALAANKSAAFPAWMHTTTWQRKELETILSSWTTVRHQTALTATLTISTSLSTDWATLWSYVEPQPEVYGRMAALVQMVIEGLDSRLMLSTGERNLLAEWKTWLVLLQDISRRELTGQTLTDLEYQRLSEYGAVIKKLSATALRLPISTTSGDIQLDDSTVIALTIADDQGQGWVEAVGHVDEIYVVIERGRRPILARGGVYSFYQPGSVPLPDAAWREQLDHSTPRPSWLDRLYP